MALQEDDDTTGDVISVNGQPTGTTNDEPEDRGDIVTIADGEGEGTGQPAAADKPAAATADSDPDADGQGGEPAARNQMIPKARFDEVNSKKNDLAVQLADTQAELLRLKSTPAPTAAAPAQPAAPAFDEAGKEEEYVHALIDGDTKRAAEIRVEINNHIRHQAAAEAVQATEHNQTARQVQQSVAEVSAQVVADFPFLDTAEGEEALELILSGRDRRIAQGMAPAAALRAAADAIAPKFAPPGEQTPGRALPDKGAPADTRTANALARGAQDSNLQPPALQIGAGNRTGASRVDVESMTEEQFENLSLADKKRLRGDL